MDMHHDCEITSIKFEGYDKYNYSIEFKVSISDSTKFEIVIPNLSLLNEKDGIICMAVSWHYIMKRKKSYGIVFVHLTKKKMLKNFLMFGNKNIKMMEL